MRMQRQHQLKLPRLHFLQTSSDHKNFSQVRKISQAQRMAIGKRHKQDNYDEDRVETDDFMTTAQMF